MINLIIGIPVKLDIHVKVKNNCLLVVSKNDQNDYWYTHQTKHSRESEIFACYLCVRIINLIIGIPIKLNIHVKVKCLFASCV